jgi:hypothetical protein
LAGYWLQHLSVRWVSIFYTLTGPVQRSSISFSGVGYSSFIRMLYVIPVPFSPRLFQLLRHTLVCKTC